MNKLLTKRLILVFAILVFPLLCIYYYYFFPRYMLGSSDVKISKYEWDSAFPEYAGYRPAYFYYHRFDNKYNYKAYKGYTYYNNGLLFGMPEETDTRYARCMERIGYVEISADDEPIIEDLLQKYRRGYLECLQNYQPSTKKEGEYLSRIIMNNVFDAYYNHVCYRQPLDMEECSISIQWIKKNSEQFESLLNNPSGLEGMDYSSLVNTDGMLRSFISFCVYSELIIDHELHEKLVTQFKSFVLE